MSVYVIRREQKCHYKETPNHLLLLSVARKREVVLWVTSSNLINDDNDQYLCLTLCDI